MPIAIVHERTSITKNGVEGEDFYEWVALEESIWV